MASLTARRGEDPGPAKDRDASGADSLRALKLGVPFDSRCARSSWFIVGVGAEAGVGADPVPIPGAGAAAAAAGGVTGSTVDAVVGAGRGITDDDADDGAAVDWVASSAETSC